MMRSVFPLCLDLSSTTRAVSKLVHLKSFPHFGNLWRIVHLQCTVSGSSCMLYGRCCLFCAQVEFSETFLRMCLPLDDPREFLQTEKEFCCSLKGDSEQQLNS